MQWLDRLSMMGVVFLLAGCSDDGLTPPLNTSGETGLMTSGNTADSATTAADTGEGGSGTNNTSDPGTTGTSAETGPTSDEGTGNASTGGPGEGPMCIDADDCILVDDCCTCAAAHVDAVPECEVPECDTSMCEALGLTEPQVLCEDDQCRLEPFNCDDSLLICDGLPPDCPRGTLPGVTEQGDCWTGACVPIEACHGVPGCEFCDPQAEVCVQVQTQLGTTTYCEPLPDECAGAPTCACLPEDTCPPPYDTCIDGGAAVQCTCPEC